MQSDSCLCIGGKDRDRRVVSVASVKTREKLECPAATVWSVERTSGLISFPKASVKQNVDISLIRVAIFFHFGDMLRNHCVPFGLRAPCDANREQVSCQRYGKRHTLTNAMCMYSRDKINVSILNLCRKTMFLLCFQAGSLSVR